ncbi:MAG TPA: aquaporin, partial [Methanocorpusculum sp.]|nr:aquaporin [Methanocorpusculum sp.]
MDLLKRSIAELVGTMLLVFIGCGSVSVLLMLAAETPTV